MIHHDIKYSRTIIKLAVDHDHKTGKVRGLLCNKHNKMLGYANDNIEILLKASDYLRSSNPLSYEI